ncbi:MAG: repressor LexA [Oscillospiraceae bacterium]|nr:repressor LexA [Oscillospiraceae bacterium]
MQYKKPEYFAGIERFIDEYKDMNGGASPSMKVIARGVGLSEGTVCKYLKVMREKGIVECEGHRHITTRRSRGDAQGSFQAPVVGTIACGLPILAEENIEEYVQLPVSLFGKGEFYVLRAKGDSMIDAGIDDRDLVVVRQQNTADYNQIVVALIEDEATLKRYRPEADRVILHAENPEFEDIIVDSCAIQGVAVKVIKDLT